MPELWVDRQGPVTRAALVEDGRLVGLEVDNDTCTPRHGARFVAKVMRVTAALDGAELELGEEGGRAFLNTRRNHLQPGDLVGVEWIAPPIGDKLALVRRLPDDGSMEGGPRLLQPGPDAVERALARRPQKIRAASAGLQRRLAALKVASELESGPVPLFEMMDVEEQISRLSARKVTFPGGYLVIEHTEAACIIDVNGVGRPAELNHAALLESARQIRLRNLGGIILIDLVGDRRNIGKGLLDQFRLASRDDSCPVNIYGITSLGLIECTRERRGWELARLLPRPE